MHRRKMGHPKVVFRCCCDHRENTLSPLSAAFHPNTTEKVLCEKANYVIQKQPKSRFSISIDAALFLRKDEGASTVAGQKQQ